MSNSADMTGKPPVQLEEPLTFWKTQWKEGNHKFHEEAVNELLTENIDLLTSGRTGLKILVTLCGKSVDLKWLAEQGHEVVGLEYSEHAAQSFFQENNVEYTSSPIETLKDGKLFTSTDGKIKIYQCDYFEFSSTVYGQFDAIWDRYAFGAVNPECRNKYRDILLSLMKPGAHCLMLTQQYDPTIMTGRSPFNTPLEAIQEFYGERCHVEKIVEVDAMLDIWTKKGHTWMTATLFHFTLKE